MRKKENVENMQYMKLENSREYKGLLITLNIYLILFFIIFIITNNFLGIAIVVISLFSNSVINERLKIIEDMLRSYRGN